MTFCRHLSQKNLIAASMLAAAVVIGPVAAAAEAPKVKPVENASPKRLLFVGNSYLYYGDSLHNHVRRMAIAADPENKKKFKYKSATISGSALHDHNIESYLEPGKLRVKKPFQVVILQGGSAVGWSKKRPPIFKKTVAEFVKKIETAGGQAALYMTHAYVNPHKRVDPNMTRTLEKIYVEAGNANGALVIPVGLAFEEAYKQRPDTKFHKTFDGSHPSLIGTFLAANVVYASLYGRSPVGNPYDYYGKIDKETVTFLQKVADKTVRNFYGRK